MENLTTPPPETIESFARIAEIQTKIHGFHTSQ